MKIKSFLLVCLILVISLFVAQNVYAKSYSINFNDYQGRLSLSEASTFGGMSKVKYAVVHVTSSTGKYSVEFGRQVATGGSYEMVAQTISTYNGGRVIYFIPQSMSCPSSGVTCIKVSEAKPGVGYDYISDEVLRSVLYLKSRALLGLSKMTGYIELFY